VFGKTAWAIFVLMSEGSVRFRLDDGETLLVRDEDLWRIYDSLWEVSEEPGAISAAALVMDAWRLHPLARKPIELTTPQSCALRKAVSRFTPE
jgi:hypothetical protein